jgi:hypothetical protein
MAGGARSYEAHPTVAGIDAGFEHGRGRFGCGALNNGHHQQNKSKNSEVDKASAAYKGGLILVSFRGEAEVALQIQIRKRGPECEGAI